MKKLFVASLAASALLMASTAQAQWVFDRAIDTPEILGAPTNGVLRVAQAPNGTVYLNLFISGTNHQVFKSTDFVSVVSAGTGEATYTQILADATQANGLQGVTTDAANNVYILGEQGTAGSGRIWKFDDAGNAVAAFGTAGTLNTSARIVALTTLSDGTILATDFGGALHSVDATTGAQTAVGNTPTVGNFVRDIVATSTDALYVARLGNLRAITGGSPANLTGYTTFSADLTAAPDQTFQIRAGVGYFAGQNLVASTSRDGHQVYLVNTTDNSVAQTLGTTGTVDATGAVDGNFFRPSDAIFFSDAGVDYLAIVQEAPSIVIYRRGERSTSSVSDWMLND